MTITPLAPYVHCDGKRLSHYDAVAPRIGASVTAYGTAVRRQFEQRGTCLVNPPEGIIASRDKLHVHQILSRHRITMPATAFAASPKDTDILMGLVGDAPPVVKLLESSQGKAVVLAETQAAAQSVISAFQGLRANFLVQAVVAEAIPTPGSPTPSRASQNTRSQRSMTCCCGNGDSSGNAERVRCHWTIASIPCCRLYRS